MKELTNKVLEIFKTLEKDHFDSPLIELDYINEYTLLVATVFSAQMTDVGVNRATEPLFELVKTPQQMIDLGEEKLKQYIKSINLFNNKAKNAIALSKILVEKFNGQVPNNFDDLVSLPGVGRKTANIVLNVAFGIPSIGVDTHVFRLSNRLGLTNEKTADKVCDVLTKIIPNEYKIKTNQWFVLHGRYVCKSQKPLCSECKLKHLCNFYKINLS